MPLIINYIYYLNIYCYNLGCLLYRALLKSTIGDGHLYKEHTINTIFGNSRSEAWVFFSSWLLSARRLATYTQSQTTQMLCWKILLLTHWSISVSHKSAEHEAEKQNWCALPGTKNPARKKPIERNLGNVLPDRMQTHRPRGIRPNEMWKNSEILWNFNKD